MLDDHFMPMTDQTRNPGGRHRNPSLLRLYFPGNSYNHMPLLLYEIAGPGRAGMTKTDAAL
jgi:hypothetical protein